VATSARTLRPKAVTDLTEHASLSIRELQSPF
jgi:hypothetical protein